MPPPHIVGEAYRSYNTGSCLSVCVWVCACVRVCIYNNIQYISLYQHYQWLCHTCGSRHFVPIIFTWLHTVGGLHLLKNLRWHYCLLNLPQIYSNAFNFECIHVRPFACPSVSNFLFGGENFWYPFMYPQAQICMDGCG